ncbi:hypothetical protein [Chlorobium phaeobacteroides]|nr:hypothetical protein [Chlorobium phaeobacteroides]
MATTLRFKPDKGHIILPLGDQMALIDTGSPASISSRPFSFGGERHTTPAQLMGFTTRQLSDLAGIAIDILIGCDILSRHKLRIRWHEQSIDIGDDTPDGDSVDEMETMSGCPIFPLRIANINTKALFDTGAHLSYISPALVAGMAQTGQKADFHPFNGHFTSPTYTMETALGGKAFTMEYGTLSGELGAAVDMTLNMTNTTAVIGTQLFQHFDCTISWKDGRISWSTNKKINKLITPATSTLAPILNFGVGLVIGF